MRINNQNRIRTLRRSIETLIPVLTEKLSFDDEPTGSDIKNSIKTKKNAFVHAKYLLGKLQDLETEDARINSADWYKDKIELLIDSAEYAMDELSAVMRQSINMREKSSAINSALEAKPEAYKYMDEIFGGVLELQGVLKSIEEGEGVKKINNDDFKTGLAEEHAYYGFYPQKERKIEPGYNKELDAVVISYDGTIGDIIECYGLRIALPKKPKKKDIHNSRKKKALQMWERPQLPDGLTKETAHLYTKEIEEEFRRRDEGYWFMNNGEYEYITGAHYMLLTHMRADAEVGAFFHFRKAHRDLFYFLEAVWLDNRSLGLMLGKARRTGATHVAVAFYVTKGISIRDAMFGMTSKKNEDARKVFEKVNTMFKSLPFFFKPINTGEGFSKSLTFQTPSRRTTKNNQGQNDHVDTINTVLNYEPTKEGSYDGSALRFYIADEFAKWESGNILNHWSVVNKTLMSGGIIRGKAFILSTVEGYTGEPYNSDNAKNGDRFRHLYEQSRFETRNPVSGKTSSGLYKIFISSLDNFGGFIDKYGNCIARTPEKTIEGVNGEMITQGVYEYLQELWRPIQNDPDALNNEKRRFPITEEDMFRIASEDSMFNILNIQDQMDWNDHHYLDTGDRGYITGNFRYVNGNEDIVEFIKDPKGRFQISWLMPPELANSYTVRNGKRGPKYYNLGCLGVDPYKIDKVKYGQGSKGAIIGYLGDHPVDDIPRNQFFLVYVGRPQTLSLFHEDVIMAMKYYSMQALIENNIPELLYELYRRDLSRYSMRRPDRNKLTDTELKYGGIPGTDPNLLKTQAAYLEEYIENHIGYAKDDTYRNIGEIGCCPFNDMLADWAKFDVNNRTQRDATVAASLAVFGTQKYLLKNKKKDRSNTHRINAADFYIFS